MKGFRYLAKDKLKRVPQTTGVYALSQGKEVLYIGKANNIQERVKNHFQKSSYRDNLFVHKVNRVGWIETSSAIDALLLESQLIKKELPKYNVMWRDDKQYFYVGITKETLPRVLITHQPQGLVDKSQIPSTKSQTNSKFLNTKYKILNTKYVGPFVDGKAIKQVLRLLRRIFPYYVLKTHPSSPCPWCHLNLCPGPNPNKATYRNNIKKLKAVLTGKRKLAAQNIQKEMHAASRVQHYEKASVLRDQFLSLERIIAHARLLTPTAESVGISMRSQEYSHVEPELQKLLGTKKRIRRIEAYDISNIQGEFATGSMVTFLNGKPAKEWYRKFKIHITGKSDDFAMMQEVVRRRLSHPEWPYPDLMVIDGGKGQLSSALKAIANLMRLSYPQLNEIKLRGIRVAALAKKKNELFFPGSRNPLLLRNLPSPVQHLFLHIRDEAHRFAIFYHRKLRRIDAFSEK